LAKEKIKKRLSQRLGGQQEFLINELKRGRFACYEVQFKVDDAIDRIEICGEAGPCLDEG
jgi:hypothetical protein